MLVTFDDLKTLYGMPYLNPSAEAQYTSLLATAEEEILEYSGLSLDEDAEEYFEGNGARSFVLLRKPVCEVVDVTVGGEPVDFRFEQRTGRIVLSRPAWGEVKVEEQLGFEGEPPRIIKQCIALTVQYWAKLMNSNLIGVSNRNNDVGSESLEQYEIPLAVKTSLDRFRQVAI